MSSNYSNYNSNDTMTDDVYFEIKSRRYIYLLITTVSLGWFTQGYQLMILNTSGK